MFHALGSLLATGVTLTIASPQGAVLVGEPVRVTVEWRARERVEPACFARCQVDHNCLSFHVRSQGVTRRYVDGEWGSGIVRILGDGLEQGEIVRDRHVLSRGSPPGAPLGEVGLFLPRPGRHVVTAVFESCGTPVESNPLTFDARSPEGREREVFEVVSRQPDILVHGSLSGSEPWEPHRDSRYLRYGRLKWFENRARGGTSPGDLLKELRAAGEFGLFEDQALELAEAWASWTGDSKLYGPIRAEILRRFPASEAAENIRARSEADLLRSRLDVILRDRTALAGETIRVAVVWRASRPVDVQPEQLQLLLDDGSGFVRWDEDAPIDCIFAFPHRLNPGRSLRREFLIGEGYRGLDRGHSPLGFAFPRSGRYRVVARYVRGGQVLESRPVQLTVVEPTGRDAELFQRLIVEPEVLTFRAFVNAETHKLLDELLDEYKGNVYLARQQVEAWRRELGLRAGTPAVDELMGAIARRSLAPSIFEIDRLLLLGRWEDVLVLAPESLAAEEARQKLAYAALRRRIAEKKIAQSEYPEP